MGKAKQDIREVELMRRAEKVWQLRLAGHYQSKIADLLGISVDTVQRDIKRIKVEYPTQTVRQLAAEQNEKLVEMMKHQFLKAIAGDRKAVDSMVKLLDHQAKLFHLYESKDDNGQANSIEAFKAMGEALREAAGTIKAQQGDAS